MLRVPGAADRRRKSAAERRAQRRRSEARMASRLVAGLESLRAHRGCDLSAAGRTLLDALQRVHSGRNEGATQEEERARASEETTRLQVAMPEHRSYLTRLCAELPWLTESEGAVALAAAEGLFHKAKRAAVACREAAATAEAVAMEVAATAVAETAAETAVEEKSQTEALNDLTNYCRTLRDALQEAMRRGALEPGEKEKLAKAVLDTVDWLSANQSAEIAELQAKQKELEVIGNTIVLGKVKDAAAAVRRGSAATVAQQK